MRVGNSHGSGGVPVAERIKRSSADPAAAARELGLARTMAGYAFVGHALENRPSRDAIERMTVAELRELLTTEGLPRQPVRMALAKLDRAEELLEPRPFQ
jgi:hypothetical protein